MVIEWLIIPKLLMMIKYLVRFYSKRILASWMILVFDLIMVIISFIFAYLIRFNFNYLLIETTDFVSQLSKVFTVYLILFLIIRPYSGIIRHTGLYDVSRIIKSCGISFSILLGISLFLYLSGLKQGFLIPNSIIIIHFLLTAFFLVGFRASIKLFFVQITRQYVKEKIPVIIYGAGSVGMLAKNALIKDSSHRYEVSCYIDDNHSKTNKSLEGIPILASDKALTNAFVLEKQVKQLIIAIHDLKTKKRKHIIDKALELNLQVKTIPSINSWINGELSTRQFRSIKIEELLGRETINLDSKNIEREIYNKVIMITGGAGSIGSEIARQVLHYSPKRLIILDQAESSIFDLKFKIFNTKAFEEQKRKIEFVVSDVKDKFRMNYFFDTYRPDIIYHAAAYKHVPLMERFPYEALMNNIFGTKVIADLSIKYGVEKFVMISTDKAINPTNIMGATKRIAEMYIQSIKNSQTKFVTTRFGNVLGSNGSVVPIFEKQLKDGGPITLTHEDITRFFMTIPEACNLVLEAGAMGGGSDIFIFDMGEPVKILDLAKKMIRLYGFTEDEILIEEIGLRPGEKLYEELMSEQEAILNTHHPQIMKAKTNTISFEKINHYFVEISELIIENDEFALVHKMKQMVPGFISSNSIFEKLDQKVKSN